MSDRVTLIQRRVLTRLADGVCGTPGSIRWHRNTRRSLTGRNLIRFDGPTNRWTITNAGLAAIGRGPGRTGDSDD